MPTGVYERTQESNRKRSATLMGKKKSLDHCAHIRQSHIGSVTTDETRKKQSIAKLGKHNTKEHNEHIHAVMQNVTKSEDAKRNMSRSSKGKKKSTKHRHSVSVGVSRYIATHKTKYSDTDIEKILYAALDVSLGLEIIKQYFIDYVGNVDFYSKEHNLVIEADGDYWHMRRGQKRRDIYRNKKLKELGYNVLRFWGSVIKRDLQTCIEITKEEISKNRNI